MSTDYTVTFDSVEVVLAKLNRRRRNPVKFRGGMCLYTDPRNPARHCIVGQIWEDHCLPVPDADTEGYAPYAADKMGTAALHADGVLLALENLQRRADAKTQSGKPWASAIDEWPAIRAQYEDAP